MDGEPTGRTVSRLGLAAFLVLAGTAHFLRPELYDRMIPDVLGPARPWTVASGVAEIAGGVLLAVPRTARIGGWFTVALFVAVFPGNVKIALEGGLPGGGWYADPTVAWLRLPLQVPLIAWALSHAVERDDDGRWVLPGRSTGGA